MTNIVLTIVIAASGLVKVTIPPTDPSHIYIVETSTNLADTNSYFNPSNHWDDSDAALIFGANYTTTFYQYPPRPIEFYRLVDLGEQ